MVNTFSCSFVPINQQAVDHATERMSACISDLKSWINENKLKLNDEKTEVLVIGRTQQRAKILISSLKVELCDVPITTSARNIGVIQDQDLTIVGHIGVRSLFRRPITPTTHKSDSP